MTVRGFKGLWSASLAALAVLGGPAQAADHIVSGTLGGQAPLWPFYIAEAKGQFASEGLDVEINFAPSPAQVMQQLTSGSIDVALSTGCDSPTEAVDKGAGVAIVRIIGKNAAYALIATPAIKAVADLRGKTVASGSKVDITDYYMRRIMAGGGLKPGDYDTLSFGVAAARYAALHAGAAQAALVLPPLNFHAPKDGYHTIALAVDYVHDIPYTCMAVQRAWAAGHKDDIRRLIAATDKSIAWLNDPANRSAALDVLVKVGKATPGDADASYDFLRRIQYFESSPLVSRKSLENELAMEREQGLVGKNLTVERLILPGVTELTQ